MRRLAAGALALALGAAPLPAGAGGAQEARPQPGQVPVVYVGVPPQRFIVDRVARGRVEVRVLVKPGESPHTFEPTPRQVVALAGSQAYFTLGFPFEEQIVSKIGSGAPLRVILMDRGVKRIPLDVVQLPGAVAEEQEGQADPHVWLSPPALVKMAANVGEALAALDPDGEGAYAGAVEAFRREVEEVDKSIAAELSPYRGRTVFVLHPAFGYFTARYGLRQVAVEVEGKSPGPRHLEWLIAEAKRQGAEAIFVQPQFDPRSARALAEATGAKVVALDPLAEDLLANLRVIAGRIAAAFGRQGG